MRRFRKKPIVIEAMLWDGIHVEDALAFMAPLEALPHAPDDPHIDTGVGFTPALGELYIPTLDGTMTAKPGDWIIKGVKGEFYPCKPDIFEASYEGVGDDADPCGTAMQMLQTWVVNHHPGHFDVSTARNVARVMIALTHEPPVEGETYEPPELLAR